MSFKGHTLLGGTVRASDECYLVSTNDDHVTTTLWRWDGSDWDSHTVTWPAVSGTVCSVPNSRYLALGKWGEVEADPTGTWTSETGVSSSGEDPTKRGPLRYIRSVAGTALAVGTERQVYERVAVSDWRCIDPDCQPSTSSDVFECIDGYSSSEIYTSGTGGELWKWNGANFTQLTSPTTNHMNCMRATPDGIYVGGNAGTLVLGRHSTWNVIPNVIPATDDLWALEWFEGDLYAATVDDVYMLKDGVFEAVDFGNDHPASCGWLSAADGIMWSIGEKDVMEFDGNSWTRVVQI